MSKCWVVCRALVFLPPIVAKSLIDNMIIANNDLPLSNNQIHFEKILIAFQTDFGNEEKLRLINWWDLIKQQDSFVDTTTVIVLT